MQLTVLWVVCTVLGTEAFICVRVVRMEVYHHGVAVAVQIQSRSFATVPYIQANQNDPHLYYFFAVCTFLSSLYTHVRSEHKRTKLITAFREKKLRGIKATTY